MKLLKLIFIVSVTLCAAQLLIFLISPYGGPLGIINIIKRGMFTAYKGYMVISTDEMYFPGNNPVKYIGWFNRICALGYFISLIGGCLSIFMFKRNLKKRYWLGICFILSAATFYFGGSLIWRLLVDTYILTSN